LFLVSFYERALSMSNNYLRRFDECLNVNQWF
jgi:hypothetical protein